MNKGIKLLVVLGVVVLLVLVIISVSSRKRAENGEKPAYEVRFHFKNKKEQSGIHFRNHIVHDAGKHYKAVHYDHGNGILVADVDNDGLLDVYFLNQIRPNALYKNLGHGRFEDMTRISRTGIEDRVSVSGSFVDYDNDGDQDLYVTTVRFENILLQNNGKGIFTDITEESGIGYNGHSSSSIFFDFDNDGLLDLFLVNVGRYTTDHLHEQGYYIGYDRAFSLHLEERFNEKSILYKNLGDGRFKDVSQDLGLEVFGWNGDASIVDYNKDYYPDLYVLDMQGDDLFFENVEGRLFKEITTQVFPMTAWGAMGIKFFDYDNDLLMDLITTDMHSDMMKTFSADEEKMKLPVQFARPVMGDVNNNVLGNTFYKKLSDRTYLETSEQMGIETYWPWGISVEDLNADGYQDIFVSSGMGYPFRYGRNALLINNEGEHFKNSAVELGIEPRKNGNIIDDYFKLDCDGADQQRAECAKNFNFEKECRTSGVCYKDGYVSGTRSSRSSVIFDLDNDGDLDIITNEFNDYPQVLISNLAQQHHINYLKVQLTGVFSNRNAIGARVTIFSDGERQVRYIDGKSGYLSQSQLPLYFGLGKQNIVDRIEILWPSGKKQVVDRDISVNSLLLISEE
jgi:enediyne biosynthesis protein E4